MGSNAAKGGKADPKAAKPTDKGGKKTSPDANSASKALILLPKGAHATAGRHMRSLAEAVLFLAGQLRSGSPLYTGVIPLLTGGDGKARGKNRGAEDDDDAMSYATSAFSFGSDLQVRKSPFEVLGTAFPLPHALPCGFYFPGEVNNR